MRLHPPHPRTPQPRNLLKLPSASDAGRILPWIAICLLLASAAMAMSPRWALASDPAGVAYLTSRGLAKHGDRWITAEEARVRGYVESLRARERKFQEATQHVAENLHRLAEMREQWASAKQEYERLTGLLAEPGLTIKRQNQLILDRNEVVPILQQLNPFFQKPGGLLDNAALRSALADLAESRSELTVAMLFVQERAVRIPDGYEQLKADADVTEALKLSGPRDKLGPIKDYERDAKRLVRLEKLLLTGSVPLYREEQQLRLGAILNEQKAVVFQYHDDEQHELTLVPARLLREAEVEVPTDRRVILKVGDQRDVEGWQVVIPTIRVGKHLLRDVPAVAVATDGEDLGLHIGLKAFSDYHVELALDEGEFRLEPKEPVETATTGSTP